MTQHGEGNHGTGSTMKEFQSQEGWKAGMPVSIPYLPFLLEPADGSPVLGKLEKKLENEQAYCLFFHRTASNSTSTVDEWVINPNSKFLQGKAGELLGFFISQSLFQFL